MRRHGGDARHLRDSYGRDGTPRVMSILSISMVLVPIFAPILGGYLQVWVGWRANFAVLAGSAAVLVVLMWWRLPETGTNLPPSGSLLRSVFANVLPLFAVPSFLGYALVVVASGGAYFAFTAVTPVILIEHFGLTPDEFGICGGLIMGGTLAGLILTNRLVTRHGIDRLIPAGIVVLAVSGVLTCALSTIHQVWAVVAPLTLMGVGIGLLAPNGHSGAIGARPESGRRRVRSHGVPANERCRRRHGGDGRCRASHHPALRIAAHRTGAGGARRFPLGASRLIKETSMDYRQLGKSGLKVSAVGIGCNNFGGTIDLEASRKVVHKAMDLGITLFDTATPTATAAARKTALGNILGERRADIVLATKSRDADGRRRRKQRAPRAATS